jgi:hypothetical protein
MKSPQHIVKEGFFCFLNNNSDAFKDNTGNKLYYRVLCFKFIAAVKSNN